MLKDGFLRFCDDPEIACCRGEAELGQLRQENIRLRAELMESQRMERAAVEDMKAMALTMRESDELSEGCCFACICDVQNLPDDYCKAVSASRAYTGLGGRGWTAKEDWHLPEQEKSMEQEAKVCAGGCIRNYADPLPHCDDCSFRQPDEKTTDISYERAAEILDPTHREHYDSMNEIEAISVLETRIKYPNSDTYGGMCEAEYQQEAVVLALEALREQAERSKGCSFCDEESGEHDYMNGLQSIDGTKYLVLETSEWDDYYDCYNDVRIPVKYCPMCGKRLEVEHGE